MDNINLYLGLHSNPNRAGRPLFQTLVLLAYVSSWSRSPLLNERDIVTAKLDVLQVVVRGQHAPSHFAQVATLTLPGRMRAYCVYLYPAQHKTSTPKLLMVKHPSQSKDWHSFRQSRNCSTSPLLPPCPGECGVYNYNRTPLPLGFRGLK